VEYQRTTPPIHEGVFTAMAGPSSYLSNISLRSPVITYATSSPDHFQANPWGYGDGRMPWTLPSVADILSALPHPLIVAPLAPITRPIVEFPIIPMPGIRYYSLPLSSYPKAPDAKPVEYNHPKPISIRRDRIGKGNTIAHLTSDTYVTRDETDPERRFPCPQCDKKFGQAEDLRRHHRTHTGERPHGCDQCAEKFVQPAHLDAHRRRHTATYRDAPYRCLWPGCTCGFLRRRELLRHVHVGHDTQ